MALTRIARRTLSDAVYDQLSDEIVQGRMPPGAALPPERTLVETLGVNRGAVREALKRLAQAGLVSIHQGAGARVLDYRRSGGLDLLASLLMRRDGSVDFKVARGLMEMREALAPDIARMCARRSPGTAAALDEIVVGMEAAGADLEALQTLSLQFWDHLVRGCDNVAYELAFNTLRETYELIRDALVEILADELRDLVSYREIVAAVRGGAQDVARQAAMKLVELGTNRMMGLIGVLEGARDGGA
jgi:DNA-binding FadR family transcriptional regulator